MTGGCNGICFKHKVKKPLKGGRYSAGQKRCQVCEIYLEWIGFWCPCCGYRLRTKPRYSKKKKNVESKITQRSKS